MSNSTEVLSKVEKISKQADRILSRAAKMENRFELEHYDKNILLAALQAAIDTLEDTQKIMKGVI